MNLSAPVLGIVGAVAGVVTAVAGYQLVTTDLPGAEASEAGAPTAVEQSAGSDHRRPSFAPCKPPAEIQGGACVTHKWRTVVVDGPSTSSVAAPSSAPSPSSSPAVRTAAYDDEFDEYDEYDDHGGDRDEYEGDDDDRDDHGDDHDDDGEDSGDHDDGEDREDD